MPLSRDGVHERLIFFGVLTRGNGRRLPPGFLRKGLGPCIRQPDLDRAQSLLSQAVAMAADLVT
jgi:hypothetical protein